MEIGIFKEIFKWVPLRFVLWFLGISCVFHLVSIRIIMGLSLVAMTVRLREMNVSSGCPYPDEGFYYDLHENHTNTSTLFDWSQNEQGQVLSAYFYGFTATQFLSGILCIFWSPKWIIGIGTFLSGVFSLLAPLAANSSLTSLIVIRVFTGLASGVLIAPSYLLFSRWTTFTERGMCIGFMYSGGTIGGVLAQVGSGYLIGGLDYNGQGWKYPFYVFGGLACAWFVFWTFFVTDFPKHSHLISSNELNILELETNENSSQDKVEVPWIAIFTSVPFWALVVCNFSHNWGTDLLQTQLPNYFQNVLHFNIQKNGVYSSAPFIINIFLGILGGIISTWMQARFNLSTNFLRKFFTILSFYGAGIFIAAIGFTGCSDWLNLFMLCSAMAFFAFFNIGCNCTFVDIAPRFSAITAGISNTVTNTAGIIGPMVTAYFATKGETLENWRYIFLIASGLYLVSCTAFLIFGSSNLQPWAEPKAVKSNTTDLQNSKHSRHSLDFNPEESSELPGQQDTTQRAP